MRRHLDRGITFEDVDRIVSINGERPKDDADYTFSQTPADNIALLNAEFVTTANKNSRLQDYK